MWALSLNGGGAAAHGTRRRGCARGLGGIRILVEGGILRHFIHFFCVDGLINRELYINLPCRKAFCLFFAFCNTKQSEPCDEASPNDIKGIPRASNGD